jgi:hypothetical protein
MADPRSRSIENPLVTPNASIRRWWTIPVVLLLVFQLLVIFALFQIRNGKEFSSDLEDYSQYVEKPLMLFRSMENQKTAGGLYASPFLPLMLYGPNTVFRIVFDQFVAFRLTMLSWLLLGFGLAWHAALKTFGVPANRKEILAMIAIVFTPVLWLGASVLSQDDCVAAGWSGICLWAWQRRGPWAAVAVLFVAIWTAKIFFAVGLLGFWIVYPKMRVRLVVLGIGIAAMAIAFVFWRDGSTKFVNAPVLPYMGGSLYALYFIFFLDSSRESAHYYTGFFRTFALIPTIAGLGTWALMGLRRQVSLPAAIVGAYSIFFAFFAAMMPEYEYWYIAWVILIMWASAKRNDWLTFAVCWAHSFFGYIYKISYSSDSTLFYKGGNGSILQEVFRRHLNFDLKWVLVFSATATVASALLLTVRLWRNDPTSSIESQKIA